MTLLCPASITAQCQYPTFTRLCVFFKIPFIFCHTRIFSSYQSSLISGGTEQADISCDKRHTWSYSLIQGYKQTTFVNACKTGWTIQRVRIDHHCSRGWARQSWFGEGELLRKFSAAQHKHKTRGMNTLSWCSRAWDLPSRDGQLTIWRRLGWR